MERSINICFSTTDGPFSALLRRAMNAPVSHSLITYHNAHFDKIMVLEVQGRGFVSVPWKRWVKHNTLVARYSLNVSREAIRGALGKLATRLGDDYDTLGLLGFLFRRFTRDGRNPLESPSKLFCSEMVAMFLQWIGVDTIDHAGSVTPKELFHLVDTTPDMFALEEHGPGYSHALTTR